MIICNGSDHLKQAKRFPNSICALFMALFSGGIFVYHILLTYHLGIYDATDSDEVVN